MAGNFVRVACPECGAEQTLFDRAASAVTCADCDATLATPTGGRADVAGEVTETVEGR